MKQYLLNYELRLDTMDRINNAYYDQTEEALDDYIRDNLDMYLNEHLMTLNLVRDIYKNLQN